MRLLPHCALILPFLAGTAASGAPAPDPFILGGDVSMLTDLEKAGAVYRDQGKSKDPIRILRDHGFNLFRLRLFVNPRKDYATCWGATQDLETVRTLAKRIRPTGAKWLLDIHYSDTWADPGHQTKPAAWKDLDLPALEKRVEDYTAGVVAALKKDGLLPDWIQIGNEITPGFLWPEGKVAGQKDKEAAWSRFARLLKAGLRGARWPLAPRDAVKLMIHIDRGGSAQAIRWFFDALAKQEVTDFDLIGLSFYPWWHGTLDDLKNALRAASTYGRDVVVVETAYPHCGGKHWTKKENMAWPVTPEGQKRFLADVIRAVRETPGGRGRGVVYWYPESIPVKGLKVWNGGTTALFDENGGILPGLDDLLSR
jgi:arabinogalactan endo-1,4-beta-galactosidase